MISQLGKELKKLRVDLGVTLVGMARDLKISSAFLSTIENGRKRVPDTFLTTLLETYPTQINKEKYEVLINQSRNEVVLSLEDASHSDVMLATALARKFGDLSEEQKETLKNCLNM